MDEAVEVELHGKLYRVSRRDYVGPSWHGIMAVEWIPGFGWDTCEVRRPETLMKIDKLIPAGPA